MPTADEPRSPDEIRAQNHRHYGTPTEAREYAEDQGGVFCEDCHVVFEPAPENENLGHRCFVGRGLDD